MLAQINDAQLEVRIVILRADFEFLLKLGGRVVVGLRADAQEICGSEGIMRAGQRAIFRDGFLKFRDGFFGKPALA